MLVEQTCGLACYNLPQVLQSSNPIVSTKDNTQSPASVLEHMSSPMAWVSRVQSKMKKHWLPYNEVLSLYIKWGIISHTFIYEKMFTQILIFTRKKVRSVHQSHDNPYQLHHWPAVLARWCIQLHHFYIHIFLLLRPMFNIISNLSHYFIETYVLNRSFLIRHLSLLHSLHFLSFRSHLCMW